jgi:hypothetical protein
MARAEAHIGRADRRFSLRRLVKRAGCFWSFAESNELRTELRQDMPLTFPYPERTLDATAQIVEFHPVKISRLLGLTKGLRTQRVCGNVSLTHMGVA